MTGALISHLLDTPVELCQKIISLLPKDDLLALCLSCRALKNESQCVLFRDVKLRGRLQLISWAHAICNRPSLGALILSLTLPTRATLSASDSLWVQKAISLTSNLQELHVKDCMTRQFRDLCLNYSMIMGCNPHLRVFNSDLQDSNEGLPPDCRPPPAPDQALAFVQNHRLVERLEISNHSGYTSSLVCAIGSAQHAFKSGHGVLAKLKILKLDNFHDLKAFSPSPLRCVILTHVAMTPPCAQVLTSLLLSFVPTLENLTLKVHESGPLRGEQAPFAMPNLLDILAEAVPNLRLLDISGDVVMHFAHEDNFLEYLSSLSKFTNLHTLIIDTANQMHRCSDWHKYLDSQFACAQLPDECQCGLAYCSEACCRFAARFFDAIGSLHRVVLGSFPKERSKPTSWVGDGSASYVKQQQNRGLWDDEVVLEGFGIFRDDAWFYTSSVPDSN